MQKNVTESIFFFFFFFFFSMSCAGNFFSAELTGPSRLKECVTTPTPGKFMYRVPKGLN